MLITISGLSGCGKSTAAKALAVALKIKTVDIGAIFRALAKKHGMEVGEFGKHVEKNPDIDRELDQAMLRRAKRDKDLILQGRLAGWMTKKHGLEAVRIWISATPQTRAGRIAKREGIPYRQALTHTVGRDKSDRRRYKSVYGLDLNDLSIYDVVIPTDNRTVAEVVDRILDKLPYGRRSKNHRKQG
ncbi:cytidylate kinase family protein [Candidatus Uhrbacteria bacterium]|nr:cytidylate kinase family protein [Candidatus Uhrbacteria bacterium]